ncbi:hypothetical protein HBI56_035200 [Parastagonospora nodorum]|nr:hypothetical protein HBH53_017870 [Parastagonospora nodorum]KAH4070976.1 hypothetical protein HBH50_074930 [Parastagonospora nodorum]KAH4093673.1 hypothetical protein HBH48_063190 [Parastagonospora nodorum]KAH4114308.1 hypothetical protein HBH47_197630 [Parastagonospora nodorum]KAH4196396.1 hypothetical protein HBI95_191790 [Parastagonospora nodorum]
MAPPSGRTRMRLTIEVLPLAPDDAHGPYRSHALASFKGRRFALPVSTDDTFETVWGQIEHRYKTSYLNAQQAANFTIKKLQDAYDCDLFMTDTVGSIYEGETDATLRLIKVVPTFLDRAFSVPSTSSLRPAHAQKRARGLEQPAATKRRRTDQSVEAIDLDALGPPRDQPVPSTEHDTRGQSRSRSRSSHSRTSSRTSRSATGSSSLVLVNGTRTGQAEFAPAIKQESPEFGSPPPRHRPTPHRSPKLPQEHGPSRRTPSRTPAGSVQPAAGPRRGSEAVGPVDEHLAVSTHDANGDADKEGVQTPQSTTQESAIQHSLPPTSAQRPQTPPRVATRRPNVYDVPSSPEFLTNEPKKAKSTYGRNVTTPRSALGFLRTPVKPASSSPRRPGTLKKPANVLQSDVNTSKTAELAPVQSLTTSSKNEGPASASTLAQPRRRGRPRIHPEQLAVTSAATPRKNLDPPCKTPLTTKSSPDLRQPARYLTHSPSTADSASDRASEEPSAVPPKPENGTAAGSDSPSAHDQSSTEEESDTDVQQTGLPGAAPYQITSSPPTFQNAPVSTPSFPATSQPTFSQQVRQTPIPLPLNAARTEASRAVARYTGFPTLREQLVDAKTPSNSSQMKPYDPRLANLAKLAVESDVKSASVDDSSDEESSSSDSD